jgi:hypothetical protein
VREDSRGGFEEVRAVPRGAARDLDRDLEGGREQFRVGDGRGDGGRGAEGLGRNRGRERHLPDADLQQPGPRRARHPRQPRDALREELRARLHVGHHEPPPHLAPRAQLLGFEQLRGPRRGAQKLHARAEAERRELRAHFQRGARPVRRQTGDLARQPRQAGTPLRALGRRAQALAHGALDRLVRAADSGRQLFPLVHRMTRLNSSPRDAATTR